MKITKTEILNLVAIVVLSVVVVWFSKQMVRDVENMVEKYGVEKEKAEKDAYGAWVKVTGNPKKLTYEEWKALSKKGLLPKEEASGTDGEAPGKPASSEGEPGRPETVGPAASEVGEGP